VFVRRSGFGVVRPGNVILFERDGRYFIHRVLRCMRRSGAGAANATGPAAMLLTKGDALDGRDLPVSQGEFLGRAIRSHRRRRHLDLHSLGQTLLGRFLASVSPASFLLYRPLRGAKKIFTRG